LAKEENQKAIDWAAVEIDYRAGVLSLRAISGRHGVSHVAIKNRADKEKWPRDLKAKIKAKADALVNRQALNKQLNKEESVNRQAAENEVVEANASLQAGIILAHRTSIQRFRDLTAHMLMELEKQTVNPELFEQLAEIMIDDGDSKAASDRAAKMRQAFDKAMSTSGRIDSLKKLSETLKVLIAMEREAFGIDGREQPEENPLLALLKQLNGTALPVVHEVVDDFEYDDD
jgi:hypothetical protein